MSTTTKRKDPVWESKGESSKNDHLRVFFSKSLFKYL